MTMNECNPLWSLALQEPTLWKLIPKIVAKIIWLYAGNLNLETTQADNLKVYTGSQ